MTLLRKAFMFAVWYLSLGPVLSLLPIPASVGGGFLRLTVSMNAGPLFLIHALLVFLYVSLFLMDFVDFEEIQFPGLMSQLSIAGALLPALYATVSCPLATDGLVVTSGENNIECFSWSEWLKPVAKPEAMCPPLSGYKEEITTTYKKNFPRYGPSSRGKPKFLGFISSLIFDVNTEHEPLIELETTFFPSQGLGETLKSAAKPGLLIFVHGGGWWVGDKFALPFPCHLAKGHALGWSVATVDYRLGRDGWAGVHEIADVKDAIRHLLKKHRGEIDASRVVLVGSSAGAHLALLAAYQLGMPTIAGVAALSPMTSVQVATGPNANTLRTTGVWDEPGATDRMCDGTLDCNGSMSPTEHISSKTPPTIIAHGTLDEYYTIAHAQVLDGALKAQPDISPHVWLRFPMTGHAFEVNPVSVQTQITYAALENLLTYVSATQN